MIEYKYDSFSNDDLFRILKAETMTEIGCIALEKLEKRSIERNSKYIEYARGRGKYDIERISVLKKELEHYQQKCMHYEEKEHFENESILNKLKAWVIIVVIIIGYIYFF